MNKNIGVGVSNEGYHFIKLTEDGIEEWLILPCLDCVDPIYIDTIEAFLITKSTFTFYADSEG